MSDHLTEELIQLYLDKNEDVNLNYIEEHLNQCPSCLKNIEAYRQIYIGLNSNPFPTLPKDFSQNVLSKISGKEESKLQFFESGIIIAFFLFGIAASLYFVNPLPFITDVTYKIVSYLGGYVSKFLPESNGYLPIFIVAILIFLLVEILDKRVIKSRL
jgi:hypothetical protein